MTIPFLTRKTILWVLVLSILQACGIKKSLHDRPEVSQYSIEETERIVINDSLFVKGNNSLRKNQYGQWELVAGGNPLELGNTMGSLTEELMVKQEAIFFSKIDSLVPTEKKQKFLKKFLKVYNRKLYKHITEEYKTEIFSISKYNSNKYDHLADKYLRSLYLHGAHDIGHALQDLALVGCSSFAVWGDKSEDGNLLLGRNFDFYVGDEFAEEKIISFIAPQNGYKYMNISWAGMIGVMSGMNDEGITVTMNAGKSSIPLKAKTPISLVTREILQYAATLDEAIAIAKKRDVFVSESIMVGSGKENKAILIELSPKKMDVYNVQNSSQQLICSNHFQSQKLKKNRKNKKHILASHSQYRYDRMAELLIEEEKINPEKAVSILRNKKGINNLSIGFGNEKALNQLLAHHGVVFHPKSKTVWVSSNPYQLGEFVSYQLDSVFANRETTQTSLSNPDLLIEKDDFLYTTSYNNYEKYRRELLFLQNIISRGENPTKDQFDNLISLNPDYWEGYNLAGTAYYEKENYKESEIYYSEALKREVTTLPEREYIYKNLKKIQRKIK